MQHIQVVISAFLVTMGVFQVEGLPSDEGGNLPRKAEEVNSAFSVESLSKTLKFENGVDILETFTHLLLGLSRNPPNGAISYDVVDVFLQELAKIAQGAAQAVNTICRTAWYDSVAHDTTSNNELPEIRYEIVASLLRKALDFQYGREVVENHYMKPWRDLIWMLSRALDGETRPAEFVISEVTKDYLDLPDLENMKPKVRRIVLESITKKLRDGARARE